MLAVQVYQMDSGEKYGEHEDDRTLVNASGAALPYSDEALKSRVQPGTMLGDYEVLELIGRGGMGYVYKVRHRILEKVYAMKTMTPEQVTETAWRRFQNEAQAIARMSHPNIVGIHNLGMHEGRRPYYVMDILEGQNLADCLDEEGPLTVDTAISIFVEVSNTRTAKVLSTAISNQAT
jgi:serine/threonine protein kinase